MKVKHLFSILFAASGLFIACNTKTDCVDCFPVSDYSKGIFVVNEGPWGGTGTISWYNPATGEVRDSIFEKANNGAVLGQFVQSMTFFQGKAYIVVNGANRVVVADATTFEYVDTISGLALPRYFLPINDAVAYVSQWGADGLSGSVAKIDLHTNKVVKTIPTGSGAEKMLYFEATKSLYVANSGGYGADSTIASFSIAQEDVVTKHTIAGQRNPACFTRSNNLSIRTPDLVLCRGDWVSPASQGWLGLPYATPVSGFEAPKGSDDLITASNGSVYFSSGTAVYQVISTGVPNKLFDQPAYCLATHPTTGNLYCGDAKDFNSAGEIVIRSPNGAQLGSFRAGIAPGEILFVE